eukprot:2618615-Rhodomonas_salina.2
MHVVLPVPLLPLTMELRVHIAPGQDVDHHRLAHGKQLRVLGRIAHAIRGHPWRRFFLLLVGSESLAERETQPRILLFWVVSDLSHLDAQLRLDVVQVREAGEQALDFLVVAQDRPHFDDLPLSVHDRAKPNIDLPQNPNVVHRLGFIDRDRAL